MRSLLARMRAATEKAYRALRRGIWLQLAVILAISLVINWKLLTISGSCVFWGNYNLPCTVSQYQAYAALAAPWSPYYAMGAPTAIPFTVALAQGTFLLPVAGFSQLLGPSGAAALYAILSTTLLGVAFLLYSRAFLRDYWSQLAASLFVTAGAFQLQLYGQGDYSEFIAEAFVFLAAYFLYLAVSREKTRWAWYPISVGCLVVSAVFLQIFLLGVAFYGASLVAYTVVLGTGPVRARLARLGALAVRCLAIPLVLTPLILPELYGAPFNLGPASSYATPTAVFVSFSTPPQAVFFTFGYVWGTGTAWQNFQGYVLVSSASGTLVADLWTSITIAGILALWATLLLLRDRRGIYLFGVAAVASLLGSGPRGPLGGATMYLYTHLVGYQVLNASYFWDWMLVVPATALGFGIVLERTLAKQPLQAAAISPSSLTPTGPAGSTRTRAQLLRKGRFLNEWSKPMALSIAALTVLSAGLPYAIGAQNGPVREENVGIQAISYPSDYASIPSTLGRLVGGAYAGVALFNPNQNWLASYASQVIPNYFLYYPTTRTPVLPGYAIPPYPSNFYSYWVYQQFYSNSTPYVGELFALMDVEFLLVFYGTQPTPGAQLPSPSSQNASALMSYQIGITPVVEAKDFAIYRNGFYGSSAAKVLALSVVSGDYSELDAMAAVGVNLTNQAIVYPSDIPAGQCDSYLPWVDRIYAPSTNALTGIALACTSNASYDPIDYLPVGGDVYDGWASSYSAVSGSLGVPVADSWPAAIAVTEYGPHTLSIPVGPTACTSCALYALVRIAPDGGPIEFEWNSVFAWLLPTNATYFGLNDSMVWFELPFSSISGGGTLSITAEGGWNAVGPIDVASPSAVQQWLENEEDGRTVILTAPSGSSRLAGSSGGGAYCDGSELENSEPQGVCSLDGKVESSSARAQVAEVSDLAPNGTWGLTETATGYVANGPVSQLVLVRVPFFTDLVPVAGGSSLEPSGGSVDSLVFFSSSGAQVSVRASSQTLLNIGYAIAGLSLVGWGGLEFIVRRFRREGKSFAIGTHQRGRQPSDAGPGDDPPAR